MRARRDFHVGRGGRSSLHPLRDQNQRGVKRLRAFDDECIATDGSVEIGEAGENGRNVLVTELGGIEIKRDWRGRRIDRGLLGGRLRWVGEPSGGPVRPQRAKWPSF